MQVNEYKSVYVDTDIVSLLPSHLDLSRLKSVECKK